MSTLHVPRCPITTYLTTLPAGSSVAGELDQEGERVDGYQRQECYAKELPTIGDSMNQEKNPECPYGHGEMVPAMGEVMKGEFTFVWGKSGFKGITGTTPFVGGI
jgi:hypothetical protein